MKSIKVWKQWRSIFRRLRCQISRNLLNPQLTEHSPRKVRYSLSCLPSAYQPLKEIKGSLVVKLMQTKLFFITLITSYSCLVKTILFNSLISPSHYNLLYFLYWRQAAYRAQLYRSVLVMVRHACAEKRQRGRAARHSLGVRCGFLSRRGNDSREISFHVSLPCLQNRISEGTSQTQLRRGSCAKFNLSRSGTHQKKKREVERVNRMKT